jgi:hypothetical protein
LDRDFYWTWVWHENNLFTSRANFFLISEAMLFAGIAALLAGSRNDLTIQVYRILAVAGAFSTLLWIYVSVVQLQLTLNPLKERAKELEPRYAEFANRQGVFGRLNFVVGVVLPAVLAILWIWLYFLP